ncbi:hypothetical protein [Paenibacillus amylolyticus]|uniref:hypothetical protein n=1 Tax=Paenibacillus amylolyticus TaxID=1451 RepID=UPI00249C0F1F|nr:hypothetical protein [Paenibacillus amylolyticus]WFA86478.1 hypothetical protein OGI70_06000 [Paenibacillus amylolyticus]
MSIREAGKGRGVKTNGLRLCWPCHDRIQTNEELLQFWISAFRDKCGDRFWFDEQDWDEYNRKQEAQQKVDQEKQNRQQSLNPVKELISSAAGRSLKAKEVRLIEMMDDKQIAIFEALINDIVRVEENHQVPFGYGHFDNQYAINSYNNEFITLFGVVFLWITEEGRQDT